MIGIDPFFQMTRSLGYPTLQSSIQKDLCLTWRNISYTVERKVNGGSLRAIFGLQHTEFIRLLNGGITSTKKIKEIILNIYNPQLYSLVHL